MANDINYQALANEGNPFIEKSSHDHETGIDETTTDTEYEDGHRDVMIHVVPDTSKGNTSTLHRTRTLSQFHFLFVGNLFVLFVLQFKRDGTTSKIWTHFSHECTITIKSMVSQL